MAENSKIEWTHHTFNPWRGCTKVSEGCRNCYADTLSKRNPEVLGIWGPNGSRVIASEVQWKLPLKWNKEAKEAGERRRVFCASLADIAEGPESMPAEALVDIDFARKRLWLLIEETPHLNWLLLTKRPQNFNRVFPSRWIDNGCPLNVWLGTSVENQDVALPRIQALYNTPRATVRFLSCEPLIGPLDIESKAVPRNGYGMPMWPCTEPLGFCIDWVIVGGESGSKKRPMELAWARSLRDQCARLGIAFFMKQVDKVQPVPDDLMIREFPSNPSWVKEAEGNGI